MSTPGVVGLLPLLPTCAGPVLVFQQLPSVTSLWTDGWCRGKPVTSPEPVLSVQDRVLALLFMVRPGQLEVQAGWTRLAAPLPSIPGLTPCAQHLKHQEGGAGREQEETAEGGVLGWGLWVECEVAPGSPQL